MASEFSTETGNLHPAVDRSPVARVRGAHCGGCHLRLLPRLLQQIRQNDGLVGCPHCGRLLFHEVPEKASLPGESEEGAGPARASGTGAGRPSSRRAAPTNRRARKPVRVSPPTKCV